MPGTEAFSQDAGGLDCKFRKGMLVESTSIPNIPQIKTHPVSFLLGLARCRNLFLCHGGCN